MLLAIELSAWVQTLLFEDLWHFCSDLKNKSSLRFSVNSAWSKRDAILPVACLHVKVMGIIFNYQVYGLPRRHGPMRKRNDGYISSVPTSCSYVHKASGCLFIAWRFRMTRVEHDFPLLLIQALRIYTTRHMNSCRTNEMPSIPGTH